MEKTPNTVMLIKAVDGAEPEFVCAARKQPLHRGRTLPALPYAASWRAGSWSRVQAAETIPRPQPLCEGTADGTPIARLLIPDRLFNQG